MSLWRSTLRARVKPLVYRFRSQFLYRVASFYVNAVDDDHDLAERFLAEPRIVAFQILPRND